MKCELDIVDNNSDNFCSLSLSLGCWLFLVNKVLFHYDRLTYKAQMASNAYDMNEKQ
jgi:hypothetical protein